MTGLSYVTNEKGQKTAVQIPLKQWDKLQDELKKLELLADINQVFREMKQYDNGSLKSPSTEQLLAQL